MTKTGVYKPCKDGVSNAVITSTEKDDPILSAGELQILPVAHICGHPADISSHVKFAGSNWSNKNFHGSHLPRSPRPHRRLKPHIARALPFSYGSMEQSEDLPHFARKLMSKAAPKNKKNIH